MKMRMAFLTTVFTSLWAITACMNLGSSPTTRFYLLESNPTAIEVKRQSGWLSDTSLGLGPVTVPSYLDRPQLVTRLGGNELRVNEFSRWAEPLRTAIPRVIEENVALLTGAGQVHSYPKKRFAVIDYQISLDVLQFDADAAGTVSLKSVWRIVNPAGHELLLGKRSSIIQPSAGNDTAAVVDAMSMALTTLSQEIAAAMVQLAGK